MSSLTKLAVGLIDHILRSMVLLGFASPDLNFLCVCFYCIGTVNWQSLTDRHFLEFYSFHRFFGSVKNRN